MSAPTRLSGRAFQAYRPVPTKLHTTIRPQTAHPRSASARSRASTSATTPAPHRSAARPSQRRPRTWLTAAQNAHDLDAMLACFHEDYRSEQPLFPARRFVGIDRVRTNWAAVLGAIPDFHAATLRSAADGDTVFTEVHWTGTKADGTALDERGVVIMGVRDDRVAWGRLYVDEVEREGGDIDAVVRRMAGD